MVYGIGEAARATGKSRSTLLRAIRASKVSAEKDAYGQWLVDPAELHRVYPEVTQSNGAYAEHETTGNMELQHKINLLERDLQAEIEKTRQQEELIGDLKDQRERLRESEAAWRAEAQRKRLTWRGLFGSGKGE